MNPYRNKDFKQIIKSIPQEEIEKEIHTEAQELQQIYRNFIDGLKIGKCFLCGSDMNSFDERKPCFHWFTYPIGIKKKYFNKYLLKPIGFFRLDCYFRWLANSEKYFVNVNDLKEETSAGSFIEMTYRYKNIEWTITIGHTDKDGHKNSQDGAMPHYHLQMKIDNNIFIKFNDFHIPFSDDDLFRLELCRQTGDCIELGYPHGYGVGILENKKALNAIDENLVITNDVKRAVFRGDTFIRAPKGTSIPLEIIQQAMEESARTKKPIGHVMKRLLPDINIIKIISPSDEVPEKAKRNGKKK